MGGSIASPKSGYPHQQYSHHPDVSERSGIEGGAPAPASALVAAEAAVADRIDTRPPSVGPKRMREWEDEPSVKKPASEENRARMEDVHHRRPSTPPHEQFRRSSSEARRAEDQRRIEEQRRVEDQRRVDDQRRAEEQRRANENYHPSEAAHHPPPHGMQSHLPPMQQGPPPPHVYEPPPQQAQPIKENPADERDHHPPQQPPQPPRMEQPPPPQPAPISEPERAARKMDVDEDYDDEGEEDKKGSIISAQGSAPPSATGDAKTTSPTGVNGHAANGLPNGQPKVESTV
ncbi:glucose repression mediator protein [Clarireedia jacksonii]